MRQDITVLVYIMCKSPFFAACRLFWNSFRNMTAWPPNWIWSFLIQTLLNWNHAKAKSFKINSCCNNLSWISQDFLQIRSQSQRKYPGLLEPEGGGAEEPWPSQILADPLVLPYRDSNINSVVEFQRWWVLTSKNFDQESKYFKEKVLKIPAMNDRSSKIGHDSRK